MAASLELLSGHAIEKSSFFEREENAKRFAHKIFAKCSLEAFEIVEVGVVTTIEI